MGPSEVGARFSRRNCTERRLVPQTGLRNHLDSHYSGIYALLILLALDRSGFALFAVHLHQDRDQGLVSRFDQGVPPSGAGTQDRGNTLPGLSPNTKQ